MLRNCTTNTQVPVLTLYLSDALYNFSTRHSPQKSFWKIPVSSNTNLISSRMCLGCYCACWILLFLPDAFSFSCSKLSDIPAVLGHRQGLHCAKAKNRKCSLSHAPEAAGGYRVKEQYKKATISSSVNWRIHFRV